MDLEKLMFTDINTNQNNISILCFVCTLVLKVYTFLRKNVFKVKIIHYYAKSILA